MKTVSGAPPFVDFFQNCPLATFFFGGVFFFFFFFLVVFERGGLQEAGDGVGLTAARETCDVNQTDSAGLSDVNPSDSPIA